MPTSPTSRPCTPRRGRRRRSEVWRSSMPQSDDAVALAPATLQPIQRVGIYHGMYMLRMIEALGVDYGALAHILGEEKFEELVRAYVLRFPSRSYTLNRLGDALPEFIAASTIKR